MAPRNERGVVDPPQQYTVEFTRQTVRLRIDGGSWNRFKMQNGKEKKKGFISSVCCVTANKLKRPHLDIHNLYTR